MTPSPQLRVIPPAKANLPQQFRLGYRPWLDGLRGTACLLVLFLHVLGPFVPGGFIGVDIFFVLSGFLISSLLLEEWEKTGSLNLKHFYIRRVLRLLPALVLLLLFWCSYSALFLSSADFHSARKEAVIALLGQANRYDVFGKMSCHFFVHTWSLSVEDKFYLFWPLVLCGLLHQRFSRPSTVLFVFLGAATCACLRARVYSINPENWRGLLASLDTRADGLLIGCLAAMLASWNMVPRSRWLVRVMKPAALLSTAFLAYLAATALNSNRYFFFGVLTLVALATAVIILTLAFSPCWPLTPIMEFKPLVWTGRISYSLYLWHVPIIMYLNMKHPRLGSLRPLLGGRVSLPFAVFVIALSFLAASVSHYTVEKFFLRFKPRPAPSTQGYTRRGLKLYPSDLPNIERERGADAGTQEDRAA
jgi:peptidoglycan/LPS O-acetylase OafA/YrhL